MNALGTNASLTSTVTPSIALNTVTPQVALSASASATSAVALLSLNNSAEASSRTTEMDIKERTDLIKYTTDDAAALYREILKADAPYIHSVNYTLNSEQGDQKSSLYIQPSNSSVSHALKFEICYTKNKSTASSKFDYYLHIGSEKQTLEHLPSEVMVSLGMLCNPDTVKQSHAFSMNFILFTSALAAIRKGKKDVEVKYQLTTVTHSDTFIISAQLEYDHKKGSHVNRFEMCVEGDQISYFKYGKGYLDRTELQGLPIYITYALDQVASSSKVHAWHNITGNKVKAMVVK